MGGTVHLALGNSYPETGGRNHSALHWDMICDLRTKGEVWVDDTLFLKEWENHCMNGTMNGNPEAIPRLSQFVRKSRN